MTVPGALSIIEAVRQRERSAVVGAGTVLDPETARACIPAGAQFIVSPSLNVATIEMCRRYSVPIMSGALTPTEVLQAWTAGSDVVKVFPCGALGGASYIKALKAPFPQIELMPKLDILISSVPVQIVDSTLLACLPPHALVVDVAAPPGGIDLAAAKARGLRQVWARGLGSRAPVTVGASQWSGIRDRIASLIAAGNAPQRCVGA